MSTEKYLGEIDCGTAADLAMAVRYDTYPFGPTFIQPLDDLILGGRSHPGQSTLLRGDLVELVGGSGSGKTTFITFLILTTILPKTLPDFLNTPAGGRESYVTLVQPNTHRIQSIISTLKRSIRNHLLSISPKIDQELVNKVITSSLSRLKIYRIKPKWKEFALTLKSILNNSVNSPRGINNPSISKGKRRENEHEEKEEGGLDLLVIDGIGDSHYTNRWNEEQKGFNSKYPFNYDNSGSKINRIFRSDEIGFREVMECIGRIRKELGTVVVISTQGLRISKESSSFFHTHLPPPYPSPYSPSSNPINDNPLITLNNPTYWPLNIQITFSGPLRYLQYPSETTLIELLNDQLKLKKQQNQNGDKNIVKTYECIVRLPQSQTGQVSTKSGGKFRFGIGIDGLVDI